jgi:hypothetical protein
MGPELSDRVRDESGAASAAEDIDLTLWQRGATDGDNSQSEIRPGQDGPGGWEF